MIRSLHKDRSLCSFLLSSSILFSDSLNLMKNLSTSQNTGGTYFLKEPLTYTSSFSFLSVLVEKEGLPTSRLSTGVSPTRAEHC